MIKKSLFLIVIFLIVGGCSKTIIDYNKIRDLQIVKTFATLDENNISLNTELIVSLGDKYKEVIVNNKEKVFAMKLNLLNINTACGIDIKSYTSKGFFAPKLIFLNKNHEIVKTVNAKYFRFDRGNFKGTVFLNEEIKEIHYLVLTQDLEEVNKKYDISVVTTSTISTGYFYYTYASGDINSTLQNAYGGEIKLTLTKYAPKILGQEDKEKK